jgi:hypothetical protein
MEPEINTTNLDQMRNQFATLRAQLDGLPRTEWNKHKAKLVRLEADIEHEEGIQRWEHKKVEAESIALEAAEMKEQVRQRSLALAGLSDTLEKNYEDIAD